MQFYPVLMRGSIEECESWATPLDEKFTKAEELCKRYSDPRSNTSFGTDGEFISTTTLSAKQILGGATNLLVGNMARTKSVHLESLKKICFRGRRKQLRGAIHKGYEKPLKAAELRLGVGWLASVGMASRPRDHLAGIRSTGNAF